MGKIMEIIKSHEAPGFISSSSGHGALKEIKSDRLREKVREQIWIKNKRQDSKLNPDNLPL